MNELKRQIEQAKRHTDGTDDARLLVSLIDNAGKALVLLVKDIKSDLRSGKKSNVYAECREAIDWGKEVGRYAQEIIQKLDNGKLKNVEKL